MEEMAHGSEDHGNVSLIRSSNHFLVTHRTTGLNNSRHTYLRGRVYAIPEWKKGI